MSAYTAHIAEYTWDRSFVNYRLGIAPCMSTRCPPDITACAEISQAFPLIFEILEAAKTWERDLRDNCSQVVYCHKFNEFNFRVCNYEGVLREVRVPGCQGVCNSPEDCVSCTSDWAIQFWIRTQYHIMPDNQPICQSFCFPLHRWPPWARLWCWQSCRYDIIMTSFSMSHVLHSNCFVTVWTSVKKKSCVL